MTFTKRKFLQLEDIQQHKKCAELLRRNYEQLQNGDSCLWDEYRQWLCWMKLSSFEPTDLKAIADRYHWHLGLAHLSLKEHNLLPPIRKGDRSPKADYLPICIYLDNVRSAYNVGSVLRTCEALRIGRVCFSPRTPDQNHEKVIRTAMGAAPLVPCERSFLKDLPRPLIALDTSDEAIPLSDFLFPESFTLILGNEEYGISNEALSISDLMLEISLVGVKNSINVAVAFGIVAAQIRNQMSSQKRIINTSEMANALFITTIAE
jgi:tRNA G18 (ribose-2'-O)-methylase SpoU